MLYRSKNDADNSVNDPIGGPDEINRKDTPLDGRAGTLLQKTGWLLSQLSLPLSGVVTSADF